MTPNPTEAQHFMTEANLRTQIAALQGALDGANDSCRAKDARIAELEREVAELRKRLNLACSEDGDFG